MNFYDLKAHTIDGQEFSFEELRGKKVIIVNTASECGYTPQYDGLEELYGDITEGGIEILGFPCNDFGGQEPGSEEEIEQFCTINYGVTFLMMEKISIKESPVYQWLTKKELNGVADVEVSWNFQKFAIDEQGRLSEVFSPATEPTDPKILKWIRQTQLF